MRRIVSIALASFLGAAPAFSQTEPVNGPPKLVKTPTALPAPTAEPQDAGAYGPSVPRQQEGPSEEDIGPVLKHFVRASETDNLAQTQHADNAMLATPEKIALDRRIKIPLVHDVQNDGTSAKGSDNHALEYELTYLNWGAVTSEQKFARRGHYFTITWTNHGTKEDFTTRFEYRQIKSKEVIRTLSSKMSQVSGSVRSYFAVVSKAYLAYGPVVSWRFTVLHGDIVVAQAQSFIW
jgi:hypothetical protein